MKNELQKITGPMLNETERVKRNVRNEIEFGKVRKRNFQWQYPLVAVLFLSIVGTLLYFEIGSNNEQLPAHEMIPIEMEPLNDMLYTSGCYSQRYFQLHFQTVDEAKLASLKWMINQSAVISLAKHEGIIITEQEIAQTVEKEMVEVQPLEWVIARNKLYWQHSGISKQQYYEQLMPYVKKAEIAVEKLAEKYGIDLTTSFGATDPIYQQATEFYTFYEAEQIEAFKKANQITSFDPQSLEPYDAQNHAHLSTKGTFDLAVGVNAQNELQFTTPQEVIDYINDNELYIVQEAAKAQNYVSQEIITLAPLHYPEVKKGLQTLASKPGELQDRAQKILDALEIFERSYDAEYFQPQ